MKAKHEGAGATQRQLRVGEAIRHALTDILRRAHFRDPDLQGANVTVAEVRVSPDLRNATAFVTPLGGAEEDRTRTVTALNRAAPYIRGELAREVELRNAPVVKFEADTSLDYAQHIDELLKRHVGE